MSFDFVRLDSKQSSIVIDAASGMPEILYWGERLHHAADFNVLKQIRARPLPQCYLNQDIPLGMSPEHSRGYFGAPGLEGSHSDGGWAPKFTLNEAIHTGNGYTFSCQDDEAKLQLDIEVLLDEETSVLQTRSRVTNRKNSPYHLQRLSNTLPLPVTATELLTFHGRWCREFQTTRHELNQGVFVQENRRGRTSHELFPGLITGARGFSEEQGEVYGFHLAWSGNHRIRAEVMSDGRRYLQAEELLQPGEIVLEHNGCYETPWLYATCSQQGLNGMSRQFHGFVREQIIQWPDASKPRPVHLNTWEGIYFDHNPEYIMEMASQAAGMGIERFIIDDGWFIGRDHDLAALGDWFLDKQKYPQGLEPVIDHVNSLGMEFGLWFEPEMVNPDSRLFKHHPDWVLGDPGYNQPTERHQYVLNLQIPECFSYLLERLDHMLSSHNIAYIKWDMNRVLIQASHNGRAAVHGQTRAFYALVDELRRRHPTVEIESCSSGGGRIDMEVLKRTHRFWTSDTNDPVERQAIQKGFSYFFPPEIMGAHIGTDVSHTTGRRNTVAFRGITALFGHMGMELDPAAATEEQKLEFSEYIKLHKQVRQLVHSGDLIRLDYPDATATATAVISKDRSEAVVSVAQVQTRNYTLPLPLRITGLDRDKHYTVSLLAAEHLDQTMQKALEWSREPIDISGELLATSGIQLPVLWPESALVLHLQA